MLVGDIIIGLICAFIVGVIIGSAYNVYDYNLVGKIVYGQSGEIESINFDYCKEDIRDLEYITLQVVDDED